MTALFNTPNRNNWIYIAIGFTLLAMMSLFCGCNADKQLAKKIEKAKTVAYQNPKSFASFCDVQYPIKTKYILGKDSIIEKTVTVKGDSIPCPDNNGKTVYVKCPDAKVVYKEIVRVDTVESESTAKLQVLQNEIDALKINNFDLKAKLATQTELKEEAKQSDSKKTWWLISLGLLLLGSAYWNVRKVLF